MLLSITTANADDLYSCNSGGDSGKKVYTSSPSGDCQRLPSYEKKNSQKPQENSEKTVIPRSQNLPLVSPTDSTATTPKKIIRPSSNYVISAETQKKRDSQRGQILLHELSSENHLLNLAVQEIERLDATDTKRLNELKNQLTITQSNIAALRQELSRLGIHVDYSSH